MGWKTYSGAARGITIDGDENASPTRWYNHLFQLLWGWRLVAVLEVADDPHRLLHLGFRDHKGKAMVMTSPLPSRAFRVRVGHEGCDFFLVDGDGMEHVLRQIIRTTKDDPKYDEYPLL